ncbi:hypothetical protein F2P81_025972 [Scophthalmus maximus]|uniref:Secreted protein n=1 Tax=Scophthalmus maximus TaxID=52904 RepID=A0A6A4RN54_SCOMX|nr:hypothetical protein F2P81_025972 [Scophthalmus maximus]
MRAVKSQPLIRFWIMICFLVCAKTHPYETRYDTYSVIRSLMTGNRNQCRVRIPTCYDKPGTSQLVQSAQSDSLVSIVLPTIHEVDLFRCFYPVFFHIQMLWELVLLGEALVVMAPSPAESSDTVLALAR